MNKWFYILGMICLLAACGNSQKKNSPFPDDPTIEKFEYQKPVEEKADTASEFDFQETPIR